MDRRKGTDAASLPNDQQEVQRDANGFVVARNGYQSRSGREVTPSQVKTPHTPGNRMPAMPVQHLNASMLLNPKAGIPRSPAKQPTNQSPFGRQTGPQLAPTFTFSSASDPVSIDDDHRPRQASMIERMHNLEDRVDRPNKRVKRSTSPSGSETSRSSHRPGGRRHGGGGVAQHIREHRAKLAEHEGTTASMMDVSDVKPHGNQLNPVDLLPVAARPAPIDLTADDAVQIIGKDTENIDLTAEPAEGGQSFYVVDGRKIHYDPDDAEEKEVCYGRVEGTRISAFKIPDPKKPITNRPEWPSIKVDLVREFGSTIGRIKAIDPAGHWFGNLDVKAAYALKDLLSSPIYRLRLEARLDVRSKDAFEAPGQPISKNMNITVNLYGPRKYAIDPVGKSLSQKGVWLRQPKWFAPNKELFNPHCSDPQLTRQARKAGMVLTGGVSTTGVKARTAEQEQNDITSLFENLQKTAELPFVEPGQDVASELLPHQKQGLGWMLKREAPKTYGGDDASGAMWRKEIQGNGDTAYVNIVTGHQTKDPPRETLGGLLADMMGLGKTLQLLSLLSYSKEQALEFCNTAPSVRSQDEVLLRNVKCTLLVCPLSVVSNWEEQITQHIREGAMSYYVYHGPSRVKDVGFLAQHDVVISTYPTVKSEFFPSGRTAQASSSPLSQMNFYRVVLDEAHFIRTPTTLQCKAANKINATRRWCLTATPVQNRLEDLGSLVTFLKVCPFDVPGIFAQFIVSPFRVGDHEAVKRLRILVDTITLRRLKDKIDLVPRRDVTMRLDFNESEQALYDFFARDASQRVNAITAGAQAHAKHKLAGKGYINILRSILCLRQISAHGKELLKDEDLKMIEGNNAGSAIDVDKEARPALDPTQAYSMFDLLKETNQAVCASCSTAVVNWTRENDEDEQIVTTMLPCYQILCNPCAKELRKTTVRLEKEGHERMECPFCKTAWRIHLFDITVSGLAHQERLKEELKAEPRKAKAMARYDGPHTKTTALIDRLLESQAETMDLRAKYPNEKPVKSVVFSAWTTHLDLIGIALANHRMQYVSLTGSMNRKQRKEAIEEFNTNDDVNVFLISIGTGGVGLNLTAASRVYLMDIGFNPMAEQQAVDRVHRLGQKREVIFTRFLMSGSIEEKILELQKKKEDLADLSLRKGAIDKTEAAKRRLEDLKDLFR